MDTVGVTPVIVVEVLEGNSSPISRGLNRRLDNFGTLF